MPLEAASPETIPIDEALRFAVVYAWDELAGLVPLRAVRVEYLVEPGILLDHVTVWLVKHRGYQDRACDYWTPTSSHAGTWHWGKGIQSTRLAHAVEFILGNQERFWHAPHNYPWYAIVVIFPPGREMRAEAGIWAAALPSRESRLRVAERRALGQSTG